MEGKCFFIMLSESVLQCINGVDSNPDVERTKYCQLRICWVECADVYC